MKNDKFCFNRTLAYLVLLVLVVVGFFSVMNKANQSSQTTKSEAQVSNLVCTDPATPGNPTNPCFAKKDTYSNKSTVCLRYTGCQFQSTGTCQTVTASSAALCVTNATCTANKITEKFTDGSCRYETGTNRTDGSCAVGYETNKGKCSPLVGASLGTASASKASCTAKLPDGTTANPCWTNYTTPTYQLDGSGTLCLENTACVNADGLTCRTKAASMTFCNAPSKATCKAKLPDGTTDNPCFAKKDTYSNASTVCLKYTGCVKADGSTCTAVTASSAALCVTNATCTANKITEKFTDGSCRYETGTNRTDGSCAVGYETNKGKCSPLVGASLGTASASKASCTAKLPDGTTANPCWTNYTTPTYQWDASGTVCLENSACVNADGLTCRTKTASSAAYCPKKMWFCDTSSSTGTCTQTADSYKSISACQNVLTPTGNNGFCFTSESLCKTGCP